MIVSKSNIFKELTILAFLAISIPFAFTSLIYPLFGIPSNAPIPIRIVLLGLAILYFLKSNNESWSGVGLKKVNKALPFILLTFLLLILQAVLPSFLQGLIGGFFQFEAADYSFFNNVHGNIKALIFWICLSWVIGGFFEELIFRGYLLNRLTGLMGDTKLSLFLAIIIQAVIFGLFHLYQGAGGVMSTTVIAILTGIFYAAYRNLWMTIIAHGLLDTLGFLAIYYNGTTNL